MIITKNAITIALTNSLVNMDYPSKVPLIFKALFKYLILYSLAVFKSNICLYLV